MAAGGVRKVRPYNIRFVWFCIRRPYATFVRETRCTRFQVSNHMRWGDIPFPRVDLMCNTECNGKWNISATLAIQILKSSTLCCSRESTLTTSNTALRESIAFCVPLQPTVGQARSAKYARRREMKYQDSQINSMDSGIYIIRLLLREQHSVLLSRTWIASVAEIFHFPYHSVLHISSTLGNGISQQRRRFNPWNLMHRVSLAKVA